MQSERKYLGLSFIFCKHRQSIKFVDKDTSREMKIMLTKLEYDLKKICNNFSCKSWKNISTGIAVKTYKIDSFLNLL